MKHLKKILVVFVLIAMIASSIIIVAVAEDQYDGNMTDAKTLYEKYQSTEVSKGESLAEAKAKTIVALYNYLQTVDPKADGYEDLAKDYNYAVVKVAYNYLQECKNASTFDEKAELMISLYTLYDEAPLIRIYDPKDPDGKNDIEPLYSVPVSYKCNNNHTPPTAVGFDTPAAIYAGIPADAACPNGCDKNDKQIVVAETVNLADIKCEANLINLDITEFVVDKLFSKIENAEKQANYYELLTVRAALSSFLESCVDFPVKLPESLIYTGSLSEIEAKISSLNENAEYAEMKTALVEIYNYLVFHPVSPAEQNYISFYEAYNALIEKFMNAFKARVDAEPDLAKKALIFNDMYTFLAGKKFEEDDLETSDVDETELYEIEPQFVSEKAINLYNQLRADIIGDYDEMVIGISSEERFEKEIPVITYNVSTLEGTTLMNGNKSGKGGITQTYEMIKAAEPAVSTIRTYFNVTIYKELTSAAKNRIDPAADGYADAMQKYNEIADFIADSYISDINNASSLEKKYTALKEFCEYLTDRPISYKAIAVYNQARVDLLEEYNDFVENMSVSFPEYNAPAEAVTNVQPDIINDLLSDVKNAQSAYIAAENEDKAAALDAWKSAAASMHAFISGVTINPNEEFLAGLRAEYALLCDALYEELISAVKAETDPALRAAALANVKEYLDSYPLLNDLLLAYNSEVEALYAGDSEKLESEKLSSIYLVATEIMERINASSPDAYDGFLEDAKLLYDSYEEILRISGVLDNAYGQFLTDYAAAEKNVSNIIVAEAKKAMNGNDINAATAAIQKYSNFLTENKYETAISKFNYTVKDVIDTLKEKAELIESDSKTRYLVSVFETFSEKAAAYNAAVSYADKMAAFTDVYDSFAALGITIHIVDPAYAAAESAYQQICNDFKALVIGTLDEERDSKIEEFNALMDVKAFLNSCNFSDDISAKYNEKLEALKLQNLADGVDIIKGTVIIEYKSPEDNYSDFGEFNTVWTPDPDNGGKNVAIVDEYINYFNKLSGAEEDIKVIDVHAEAFLQIIKDYSYATELYETEIKDLYKAIEKSSKTDAEKRTDKIALLDSVKKDFGGITVTSSLKALYSSIEEEVSYSFKANVKATFLKYKNLTAEVHSYMVSCPVDTGAFLNDSAEKLDELEEFLDSCTLSAAISNKYNKKLDELKKDLASGNSFSTEKYIEKLDALKEVLDSCSLSTEISDKYNEKLDELKEYKLYYEINRYNTLMFKLEGAEYLEAESYVFDFDNTTGNIQSLSKKYIYDSLTTYLEKYPLDKDYNDKKLMDVLLAEMFTSFLNEFDKSLEGLDETAQNTSIENLSYSLEYKCFPEILVNIFNTRYPQYPATAKAPAATANVGSFVNVADSIAEFKAADTADEMIIQLSVVVATLNEAPISSECIKNYIDSSISPMKSFINQALAKAKEDAQKNAYFSDYSLGDQFLYDMENGKPYASSFSGNTDGRGTVSVKNGVGYDGNATQYAEMKISGDGSGPYFNVVKFDSTSSFVLEFDFMIPDVENAFGNFYINSTEYGLNEPEKQLRVTSKLLNIEADGKISYITGDFSNTRNDEGFPNYQEGVDDPIYLRSGEWARISIVIDPIAYTIELVVNETSLGTKPLIVAASSTGNDDTCQFTELRFQTTNKTTYCYDNLKVYTGGSYRDPKRFDNKTDDQLFNFYTEYAANEEYLVPNRIASYQMAKSLYDNNKATSEEHKKIFESISVDEIIENAQIYFEAELTKLTKPLKEAITTVNSSEKQLAINSLRSYIEANSAYMKQDADWLADAQNTLVEAEEQLVWLENLKEYVKVLPFFQRAPSLAALKKYYAVANQYYELCALNKAENVEKANNDPLVQSTLETLRQNDDVSNVLTKNDIGIYHNVYMSERIRLQTYSENAKKLVACIEAIELLVPDKTDLTQDRYYELLVEKASENIKEFMKGDNCECTEPEDNDKNGICDRCGKKVKNKIDVNAYMNAINYIVDSGEYDDDYNNVDSALEIYRLLDEMLYDLLQTSYYDHLEAQMARYKETNSYIERAGICTYMENYIAENSVDLTSQRGTLINYALAAYKEELVTYKSEYESILEANTKIFISIVDRMQAYTEYKDLKPLYQDAIDNYYYNMNVDSEAAKNAIAIFAIYEDMINEWELSSNLFMNYAESLNSRRPAQIYRALVNCAKYVDGVNSDIDGVADMLELYNETLAEYNATIEATNGEISAAIDIACSVRTNSVAATVLAVIKSIFTK